MVYSIPIIPVSRPVMPSLLPLGSPSIVFGVFSYIPASCAYAYVCASVCLLVSCQWLQLSVCACVRLLASLSVNGSSCQCVCLLVSLSVNGSSCVCVSVGQSVCQWLQLSVLCYCTSITNYKPDKLSVYYDQF